MSDAHVSADPAHPADAPPNPVGLATLILLSSFDQAVPILRAVAASAMNFKTAGRRFSADDHAAAVAVVAELRRTIDEMADE